MLKLVSNIYGTDHLIGGRKILSLHTHVKYSTKWKSQFYQSLGYHCKDKADLTVSNPQAVSAGVKWTCQGDNTVISDLLMEKIDAWLSADLASVVSELLTWITYAGQQYRVAIFSSSQTQTL